MKKYSVALIVGSLRKLSLNRKMANALIKMAPENLNMQIVEIGDLALYNQDLDEDTPASWTAFRTALKSYDAVLFLTPEYNRSIPSALKNALDIGSRPAGQNAWTNKPGAIISVTPGRLGAFGANHHLRQILVSLNIATMPQPEAYIGSANTLFDEDNNIIVEQTKEAMQKYLAAFAKWIQRLDMA